MNDPENIFNDLYLKLKLTEKQNFIEEFDPFASVKQENILVFETAEKSSDDYVEDEMNNVKVEILKTNEQGDNPFKLERFLNESETVFPCDYCIFETSTLENLDAHKSIIHKEKTNNKEKAKAFNNIPNVEDNIGEKATICSVSFQCDKCDFKAKKQRNLISHVEHVHKEVKRFACQLCDFASYFKHNVTNHAKTKHKDKQFRVIGIGCEYCEKEAKHNNCLVPGTTPIEPKKFKKDKLREIQPNIQKQEGAVTNMYSCDACPYESFKQRNVRNHHKSNHKNHDCGVLYDGVKLGNWRRVSKKRNANEGKYKCNICEYRYDQKPVVRRHQKTHHKDKECIIIGIGCESCIKELLHHKCKFNGIQRRKSHKLSDEIQISCEQCPAKISQSYLKKHVEASHLGYVNFSCGECSYKSYYKHHVMLHLKGVHKNMDGIIINSIDCIYCRKLETHEECKIEKIITKRGRRNVWLKKANNSGKKNRFSCDQCTYKTYFKYKVLTHLRIEHGKDKSSNYDEGVKKEKANENSREMFPCGKCDFQTDREDTLMNHTNNVHLEVKRFACSYCEYKSYYRNHINYHLQRQHKDLEQNILIIGCSKCESKEKHQICSNGEFAYPMRRKKREQRIEESTCRICRITAINKSDMIKHFKSQHAGKSVFACELCNYESNWIANLVNHKSSIHEKTTFNCDQCTYTAKWKVLFLEHRREKHGIFMRKSKFSGSSGLGETLCDLCGFSAPTLKSLNFHTRKEHNDSQTSTTKCNVCDYKTPYPAVLKLHKKAKHEEFRYPCLECDYTATTEINLRAHTKYKHTLGNNSLKCNVCSYATTFPGNLKTHMKGKHFTPEMIKQI